MSPEFSALNRWSPTIFIFKQLLDYNLACDSRICVGTHARVAKDNVWWRQISCNRIIAYSFTSLVHVPSDLHSYQDRDQLDPDIIVMQLWYKAYIVEVVLRASKSCWQHNLNWNNACSDTSATSGTQFEVFGNLYKERAIALLKDFYLDGNPGGKLCSVYLNSTALDVTLLTSCFFENQWLERLGIRSHSFSCIVWYSFSLMSL